MTVETCTILPTNKYNRPAPPAKVPLHGLDLLSPAIQIHNHRFYRPPSSVTVNDVIAQLKVSLAEALELYPPVAGTVLAGDDGEVYITLDADNMQGTPFMVDLKDTPYVADAEDLSPRTEPVLAPNSSTLAVKVTQFSCGTICVASSFHHQVADLRGFLDFLELWAQLCRKDPVDFKWIPDDWNHTPDRFFSDLIKQVKEEQGSSIIPPPPPFSLLDAPAVAPPAFFMVSSAVTRWKITKSSMEQMKADLSPTPGSEEHKAGLWISSGDALAALVSGTITRARHYANIARMEGRSSVESQEESIAMAADGRDRAPGKDMSGGRYLGNFNNLWAVTVSRTDLSTPTSESAGRIALAIRKNLGIQLSSEAVAKRIAFFEQAEVKSSLGRVGWAADVILTNWCTFDLQGPKLDFGWGKPFEATSGGVTFYPPGYCLMTQEKESGDVFVLVTVERAAEAALVADLLMNKYAVLVSSA
ncbi:hypothetical protein BGX29_003151 [Mortierella sp. GBA35]|nr:hypothetical protein BGX29_003151 [Mortierella sp. GBA35]